MTLDREDAPGLDQAAEQEEHSEPWTRFEDAVTEIVRVPLELIQRQVTDATENLARRVQDLVSRQRNFEEDLRQSLDQLNAGLTDLQDRSAAAAAAAATGLDVHGEKIARLADRADGAAIALDGRLDAAVKAVKQEIETAAAGLAEQIRQSHDQLRAVQMRELTSKIAALGDPLRAIEAEVRAVEERTKTRQERVIASLREAMENELGAVTRRSSEADQAFARRLTQLRRTSYVLLALLIVLAACLPAIAIAS